MFFTQKGVFLSNKIMCVGHLSSKQVPLRDAPTAGIRRRLPLHRDTEAVGGAGTKAPS